MSFYRDALGEMQRRFSKRKSVFNDKYDRPSFVKRNDPLGRPLKNLSKLYKKGELVYAKLVTGNSQLFEDYPKFFCLPGRVIYSTDSFYKDFPEELSRISDQLLRLRTETKIPADCQDIANIMRESGAGDERVAVPVSLTDGREVYLSTVLINLNFLQGKHITSDIFPIICNPKSTTDVFMLHRRYWTKEFKEFYVNSGKEAGVIPQKKKKVWITNFDKKKITFRAILFLIMFIGLMWGSLVVYKLWAEDQKTIAEEGIPSFNAMTMEELESGKIVKGEVREVFDEFAARYEERMGIRVSDLPKNRFLIIPNGYQETRDGAFYDHVMVLKVDAGSTGEFDTVDSMILSFKEGIKTDTYLNIEHGFIFRLPEDASMALDEYVKNENLYEGGSFIDWCAEVNLLGTKHKEQIASRIVPYMIDPSPEAGSAIFPIFFLLPFAFLMLLFAVLDIRELVKHRKEKA